MAARAAMGRYVNSKAFCYACDTAVSKFLCLCVMFVLMYKSEHTCLQSLQTVPELEIMRPLIVHSRALVTGGGALFAMGGATLLVTQGSMVIAKVFLDQKRVGG